MTANGATPTAENPETDTVAFIVAADHRSTTFGIDDAAFEAWFAGHGDADGAAAEPAEWLPDWSECGAGATLARVFGDARRHGVVTGDPDVELNIYGDDDGETSGFCVILSNRAGLQTALGLTSGWQEVLHLDELPRRRQARAYLEEVCAIANFTLANLQVFAAG